MALGRADGERFLNVRQGRAGCLFVCHTTRVYHVRVTLECHWSGLYDARLQVGLCFGSSSWRVKAAVSDILYSVGRAVLFVCVSLLLGVAEPGAALD